MGTLSIVATPIGNLEDMTLRAIRTLKEADVIFCEDTRVAAKLLARYEISKPLVRCDETTEEKAAKQAVDMLQEGKRIALVSDAGTPGISDPGARLVARVREQLLQGGGEFFSTRTTGGSEKNSSPFPCRVEAIPGPSALTAALSIAGLRSGEFLFLGFLPHKKGRLTALKQIAVSHIPVVLYESPHRISKLLAELAAHGVQKVGVARELTKIHEEFLSGEPLSIKEGLETRGADRGEFVVIVER